MVEEENVSVKEQFDGEGAKTEKQNNTVNTNYMNYMICNIIKYYSLFLLWLLVNKIPVGDE